MITIQYNKFFFKFVEIIHDKITKEQLTERADVILGLELLFTPEESLYIGKEKNSLSLIIPNYLIDLSMDEEEIFNRIHKNARYKIKRAIKRDQLEYVEINSPTNSQIEEFRNFYDPFAKLKNIRGCNVDRLKALRDQDALVISYIKDRDKKILCYHVYSIDQNQAYLIYSASRRYEEDSLDERNLIGRANRYLHWKDITHFKKKGCRWYNFGGKIIDPKDINGQNVNRFKLEFEPTVGYDARTFISQNLKGSIAILLFKLKWWGKPEYIYSKEQESIIKRNLAQM